MGSADRFQPESLRCLRGKQTCAILHSAHSACSTDPQCIGDWQARCSGGMIFKGSYDPVDQISRHQRARCVMDQDVPYSRRQSI